MFFQTQDKNLLNNNNLISNFKNISKFYFSNSDLFLLILKKLNHKEYYFSLTFRNGVNDK